MASTRTRVGVGFLLGLASGVALSVAFAFILARADSKRPIYVLTRPLNLLERSPDSPIRAVLLPGTQFKTYMRKADINYVEFQTVVLDRDLAGNGKPLDPSRKAPWDEATEAIRAAKPGA